MGGLAMAAKGLAIQVELWTKDDPKKKLIIDKTQKKNWFRSWMCNNTTLNQFYKNQMIQAIQIQNNLYIPSLI